MAECVRSGAGCHVDIEDAQGREPEAEWRPLHHQPLVYSPGTPRAGFEVRAIAEEQAHEAYACVAAAAFFPNMDLIELFLGSPHLIESLGFRV